MKRVLFKEEFGGIRDATRNLDVGSVEEAQTSCTKWPCETTNWYLFLSVMDEMREEPISEYAKDDAAGTRVGCCVWPQTFTFRQIRECFVW